MKLLCITEPSTHPEFDTTVELYNRLAESPMISLSHTSPDAVIECEEVRVTGVPAPLSYREFLGLNAAPYRHSRLDSFDLIFSRADKPLPEGFHASLGRYEGSVRFVNSPSGCEAVYRRSFLSRFEHAMPPHLFTSDITEAEAFVTEHRDVVIKQDVGYGGKGVFRATLRGSEAVLDHITEGTTIFTSTLGLLREVWRREGKTFQLVRFLPRADEGDKRVLVVGGEIYGGFIRRSTSGHWVHNITSGGDYHQAEVTQRERTIITSTAPEYTKLGVHTLGYDFLMDDDGEWILSEINAGNIGGYGRLERLSGEPIYSRLISWLVQFASQNEDKEAPQIALAERTRYT